MQRTTETVRRPETESNSRGPVALTLDERDAALLRRALRLLAKRSIRAQQLLARLTWHPAA